MPASPGPTPTPTPTPTLTPTPTPPPANVGYHVYSNQGLGDPIDYEHPAATVYGTIYQTQGLEFPGTWKFAVRAFDTVTEMEEANVDATVTIVLGPTGTNASALPSAPVGLLAVPGSAGSIRLHWTYPSNAYIPTGFHVYLGTSGSPDYSTVVSTKLATDYSVNPQYSCLLSGLTDGTTYAIGVRAYNGAGEEANTTYVSARAVIAGPGAVTSFSISTT